MTEPSSISANSLQCDECGRQFRDSSAAQAHAKKTQHQSFSESVAIIKPLTDEEKKQKLQLLRDQLSEKRQLEAGKELQNVKDNAAIERKKTQESAEVVEEMKRKADLAEIARRKKEKAEDLTARARVKAQVEQDRKDRAERTAREKAARQGIPAAVPTIAVSSVLQGSDAHSFARLQIRHQKGPAIIRTWAKDVTMMQVAIDIVELTQVTPSDAIFKMFGQVIKGSSLNQTLEQLHLLPSAALQLSGV